MQSNVNKNTFKWINKDLVCKIIQNDTEIKAGECKNFTVSNFCAEGANFVSHLLKLEAYIQDDGKELRKCYVIKIIDRESRFGKFVDLGIFFYAVLEHLFDLRRFLQMKYLIKKLQCMRKFYRN